MIELDSPRTQIRGASNKNFEEVKSSKLLANLENFFQGFFSLMLNFPRVLGSSRFQFTRIGVLEEQKISDKQFRG